MARPTTGRPTDLELEILKVLWERGPSSVREVWKTMAASRPIGYTTVLKIMQIMRDKELLACDASQRPQVYRTRQSQRKVLKLLAGDLVDRVFGGSTRLLLLHALEGMRSRPDELKEIRDLLDQIERGSP